VTAGVTAGMFAIFGGAFGPNQSSYAYQGADCFCHAVVNMAVEKTFGNQQAAHYGVRLGLTKEAEIRGLPKAFKTR
jgi:hypothetical protein